MSRSALASQFIPASSVHVGGPNGPIKWIVVHGTVSACVVGGAVNNARYFQNPAAGGAAHYCLTPENRVLSDTLEWIPLGDLAVGDGLVTVDEESVSPAPRHLVPGEVEAVERRRAECLRIELEDGRVLMATRDHRMLRQVESGKRAGYWHWCEAENLVPGAIISAPLQTWQAPDIEMAWLGGLIDGEGSYNSAYQSRAITFSQKDGAVYDQAREVLDRAGIRHTVSKNRPSNGSSIVNVIRLSGIQGMLETLGRGRPVRFVDRHDVWAGRAFNNWRYKAGVRIRSIQAAGRREVVSIQTSTRTYIAEGVVHHNCVDPGTIICSVDEDFVAHHAPPNTGSIGVEFCDWQGLKNEGNLWPDQPHQQMLGLGAKLVADIADRKSVPKVWLSVDDLLDGRHGIASHANIAKAFRKSDHTDPGQYFPVEQFMSLVTGASAPVPPHPQEPEMQFIMEFKDKPGTLWLVDVQAIGNGNDHDPTHKYGTRTRVIDPPTLYRLAEQGVPVRSGQHEGMELYLEKV